MASTQLDLRVDAWKDRYRLRFQAELDLVNGVGPKSSRGQAVLAASLRTAESLIGDILTELGTPDSRLVRAIVEEGWDVESTKQLVLQLNELIAHGNRRRKARTIAKAVGALGLVFTSIVTGISEGISGNVIEISRRDKQEETSSEVLHSVAEACDSLSKAIESEAERATSRSSGPRPSATSRSSGPRPSSPRSSGPGPSATSRSSGPRPTETPRSPGPPPSGKPRPPAPPTSSNPRPSDPRPKPSPRRARDVDGPRWVRPRLTYSTDDVERFRQAQARRR